VKFQNKVVIIFFSVDNYGAGSFQLSGSQCGIMRSREIANYMKQENDNMRIAIPIANGALCAHFGHCEKFALIDVDQEAKTITGREEVTPPTHEPGVFPRWLGEQGVTIIIAGGMGQRAQSLFNQQNISVVVGTTGLPDDLVLDYLAGTIKSGENFCDH